MAATGDVRLCFGVLDWEVMNVVVVSRSADVFELRDAIAARLNANALADRLALYKPTDRERYHEELTAGALNFLRAARVPNQGFQLMLPFDSVDQYFGPDEPVNPRELHVVVEVTAKRPRVEPNDNVQPQHVIVQPQPVTVQWQYDAGDFPQLRVDDNGKTLTIPQSYLAGSGIKPPQADAPLVLYRREGLESEWAELQLCSIELTAMLYIVGSPGSGKSCAAYAFACSRVDRSVWTVVWLHRARVGRLVSLVLLQDNKKAVVKLKKLSEEAFMRLLDDLEASSTDSNKKIIVFLDGYVGGDAWYQEMAESLSGWHSTDETKRRFVCVSSLGTMGKLAFGEPVDQKHPLIGEQHQFILPSWTLDEYIAAVSEPAFANTVRSNLASLDTKMVAPKSIEELVREKYYYVGGSARLMFCYTTQHALKIVDRAIAAVSDPSTLLGGFTGSTTPVTTNMLLGYHQSDHSKRLEPFMVSMYAAGKVALKMDADRVKQLARLIGFNPASHAHTLKNWFLFTVVSKGVTYKGYDYALTKLEETLRLFCVEDVHAFDPHTTRFPLSPGLHVLTQRNEAAYDALVCRISPATDEEPEERHLMFVRVLEVETHSFDPAPFKEVVQRFVEDSAGRATKKRKTTATTTKKAPLDRVDLCYVVPNAKLDTFRFPPGVGTFKSAVVNSIGAASLRNVQCNVMVVGVAYDSSRLSQSFLLHSL